MLHLNNLHSKHNQVHLKLVNKVGNILVVQQQKFVDETNGKYLHLRKRKIFIFKVHLRSDSK